VEADDPLIWYEGSAQIDTARRHLHTDPRGSIVAVTDYRGDVLGINSYDSYGIPDTDSGEDIATKGRFQLPRGNCSARSIIVSLRTSRCRTAVSSA
jgi:hypothetical protein